MPPSLIDVPMDIKGVNASTLFKDLQVARKLRLGMAAIVGESIDLVIINASRDVGAYITVFYGPDDPVNTVQEPPAMDPYDPDELLDRRRMLGGEAFVGMGSDASTSSAISDAHHRLQMYSMMEAAGSEHVLSEEEELDISHEEGGHAMSHDPTSSWYMLNGVGWREGSASRRAKRRLSPEERSVQTLRNQYRASHYAGYYNNWYDQYAEFLHDPMTKQWLGASKKRLSANQGSADSSGILHGGRYLAANGSFINATAPSWPGPPSVAPAPARQRNLQASGTGTRLTIRIIVPAMSVNDTYGDGTPVVNSQRLAIAVVLDRINATITAGNLSSALSAFTQLLSLETGLPQSTFDPYIDQAFIVALIPQPRFAYPSSPPPVLTAAEATGISLATIVGAILVAVTVTFLLRMRYARDGKLPTDKKAWTKEAAEEIVMSEDDIDLSKMTPEEKERHMRMKIMRGDAFDDGVEIKVKRTRATILQDRNKQARKADLVRHHVSRDVRQLVKDPAMRRRLEKSRSRSRSRGPPELAAREQNLLEAILSASTKLFSPGGSIARVAPEPVPVDGDASPTLRPSGRPTSAKVAPAPMAPPRYVGSPQDADIGARPVEEEGDALAEDQQAQQRGADHELEAEVDEILGSMMYAAAGKKKAAAAAAPKQDDGTAINIADSPTMGAQVSPSGDRIIEFLAADAGEAPVDEAAPYTMTKRDRKRIERQLMRSHAGRQAGKADSVMAFRAAIDTDTLMAALQQRHLADIAARRHPGADDESEEEEDEDEMEQGDFTDNVPSGAGPSADEVMAMIDQVTSIPSPPGERLGRVPSDGEAAEAKGDEEGNLRDLMLQGPVAERPQRRLSVLGGRTLPPLGNVHGSLSGVESDGIGAPPEGGASDNELAKDSIEDTLDSIGMGAGSAFSRPSTNGNNARRGAKPSSAARQRRAVPVILGSSESEDDDDDDGGAQMPPRMPGMASHYDLRAHGSDGNSSQEEEESARAGIRAAIRAALPPESAVPGRGAARLDLMPPSAEDLLDRVRRVYDMERARIESEASQVQFPPRPMGMGPPSIGSPSSAAGNPRLGLGLPGIINNSISGGRRQQLVRRIDPSLYASPYLDSAGGRPRAPPGLPGGPPGVLAALAGRRGSGSRRDSVSRAAGGGNSGRSSRGESPKAAGINEPVMEAAGVPVQWPIEDMRGGVPTTSAQGRRNNYLAAYDAVTSPLGASGTSVVSPLSLGIQRPTIGPAIITPTASAAASGGQLLPGAAPSVASGSNDSLGATRPLAHARSTNQMLAAIHPATAIGGHRVPMPGSIGRASTVGPSVIRPTGQPTIRGAGINLDSAATSDLVTQDSPERQAQAPRPGAGGLDQPGAQRGGRLFI